MAFDSKRGRVVSFGGRSVEDNHFFGDTWEWDGSYWTQLDDVGPAPRIGHSMTYDADRQVTLLFGGALDGSMGGDTWQWDGQDWTQLAESGPTARQSQAMAFDTGRKRTVLFGGKNGPPLQDTWEFDGQDWTQQEDSGPQARDGHAMAYDPSGSRVVLFGGGTPALGDTWAWDGTAWVRIAGFGPRPRRGAALTWMGDAIVLFGSDDGTASMGDTWEFDGKRWTQRQDMGPMPRADHALVFDSSRSRLVLFGGGAITADPAKPIISLGDTWEHQEDAPVAPGPGVTALSLAPANGPPGTAITATITLRDTVLAPLAVHMHIVGPLGFTQSLADILVPAGAGTTQTQFFAPHLPLGAQIAVMAGTDGTPEVQAMFQFE
jgi:hypothetical protein